jgi:hypothetical protein
VTTFRCSAAEPNTLDIPRPTTVLDAGIGCRAAAVSKDTAGGARFHEGAG